MPRHTSNSNTCISQNIPGYENVGFCCKKRKYFARSLYVYTTTCIKFNNTASNLKQDK